MFNLATIANMIGLKLEQKDIDNLQTLLPQIPGKLNEVLTYIQTVVKVFDARLQALEQSNQRIETKLDAILNGEK